MGSVKCKAMELVETAGRLYAALQAKCVAADVVQPILSVWQYCGPGGDFECTLHPEAGAKLKHLKTGAEVPLRWEEHKAPRSPAILNRRLADLPHMPALHNSPWCAYAHAPSCMPHQSHRAAWCGLRCFSQHHTQ